MQASVAIFRSSASAPPDDGPFLDRPIARSRSRFAWARRVPWRFVALLLLTIAAGVARFTRLENPTIWVDESATFRRVCGTFDQMLDTLREDPFGPLFYEAEWAMRHWHALTPFWLRFVPALASALTVPAMYFLARQFVAVRTALLATTFTLCSAWMINYGRDAKMYATFWLFVVLFGGAFFCWLRTHSWTSWLAWIAAGSAMVGLNAWGVTLLALTPIWLITARRVHWTMGPALIGGLAILLIGPAGFYGSFNRWADRASHDRELSNVPWIISRNQDLSTLELVKDSSSALLFCFTYAEEGFHQDKPVPPPAVFAAATIGLAAIAAFAAIGLLPWRSKRWRSGPNTPPADLQYLAGVPNGIVRSRAGTLGESAVITVEEFDAATIADDALPSWRIAPEPAWRVSLWLSLWLLVPMYIFYCMSFPNPVSPMDWLNGLQAWAGPHLAWIGGTVVILAIVMTLWPFAARIGMTIIAVGIAVTVLWACVAGLHATGDPALPWQKPLIGVDRWLQLISDQRFAVPVIVLSLAAAFARCAPSWPRRIRRTLAIALVIAVVIGLLIGTQAVCLAALAEMRQKGMHPSTIWLPRYQGFVWPAMAIILSALLLRIPTFPLRWSAIALLLGMNLFAGGVRVFGSTEPPIDRMAIDAQAAENSKGHTRLFIGPNYPAGPGPTAGRIENDIGRYYLLNQRTDLTPWSFSDTRVFGLAGIRRTMNPDAIARNASTPEVNRLIVWFPDRTDDAALAPQKDLIVDKITPRLGPAWTLESEQITPVRYFWCWAERYMLYRREYVRVSSATTKPAARAN